MQLGPRHGSHRSTLHPDSLLPPVPVRWVLAVVGLAGLVSVVMAARA